MISKKYKKHREDDIFNYLPPNNNHNKRKTVLFEQGLYVRPL